MSDSVRIIKLFAKLIEKASKSKPMMPPTDTLYYATPVYYDFSSEYQRYNKRKSKILDNE